MKKGVKSYRRHHHPKKTLRKKKGGEIKKYSINISRKIEDDDKILSLFVKERNAILNHNDGKTNYSRVLYLIYTVCLINMFSASGSFIFHTMDKIMDLITTESFLLPDQLDYDPVIHKVEPEAFANRSYTKAYEVDIKENIRKNYLRMGHIVSQIIFTTTKYKNIIVLSYSDNMLFITIRASVELYHYYTDAKLAPIAFDLPSIENSFVHTGFYQQTMDVYPELVQALHTEFSLNPPETFRKIILSGYSLGASVAVITAVKLLLDNIIPDKNQLYILLFGCPNTGNAAFTNFFEREFKDQYVSVINERDFVARVCDSKYNHLKNVLVISNTPETFEETVAFHQHETCVPRGILSHLWKAKFKANDDLTYHFITHYARSLYHQIMDEKVNISQYMYDHQPISSRQSLRENPDFSFYKNLFDLRLVLQTARTIRQTATGTRKKKKTPTTLSPLHIYQRSK